MKSNKDELALIRDRDADFGTNIPSHCTGPLDRRTLLRLLDETWRHDHMDSRSGDYHGS